jgi:sigma-B regulation protein RsbU (phosphoserine phosphatase)
MFATVFFAVADTHTGEMRYVNGGHDAPLVLSASGGIAAELSPTGPAVGMLPESSYAVGTAAVGPGETLFAYTDGVTDAKGSTGFFGRARLRLSSTGSGGRSGLTSRTANATTT